LIHIGNIGFGSKESKMKAEKNKNKMKICFFGGDAFSIPTLKALSPSHTLSVVTNPRSPVSTHARNSAIPLQTFQTLSQYKPITADIAVVVSFGHFLPPSLIDSFPLGAINLHPSLLPKYRGPNPIMHALLNDDTETGCSIITLDKKRFDAGLILRQERFGIPRGTRYGGLHDALAERGARLIAECVESEDGFRVAVAGGWKQDEALVSRAGKFGTLDSLVDFKTMDAEGVCRLDRAIGDKVRR
jgi:methionyl-tRNA formyltransferase